MYINTNNHTHPCAGFSRSEDEVRIRLTGDNLPETLGETVELCQNDGFVMAEVTVADYERWEIMGNMLVLTNRPVPEPVPDPAPDLEVVRSAKMDEISWACREAIVAGCDATLTDGTTNHYALEETDQINLTAAVSAVEQGADGYPYHADGQLCKVYPAADILAVTQAATEHKLYHTTLCNHLLAWARRAETVEELEGIVYGAALPADLDANMKAVLGNG